MSLALARWRPGRLQRDATDARDRCSAGAVDVLPEGRLAEQLAEGRPLRVKFGVDPTSPDIHLGHCVVLNKLRAFQDAGHTVVLIIGDYTARVGDPSGRDATRPVLTDERDRGQRAHLPGAGVQGARPRAHRAAPQQRVAGRWRAPSSSTLVRRFTVARLLERDDFSRRMADAQPISVLELLYPVLQGYDSVAIEADVELGGTDQKFNLLFGRDVQEAYGQAPQSILTMPILPGHRRRAQDEQVLRQLRRRHRSAGGDVRQADEHPRRGRWASTTCCCSASSSTAGRPPGEAKRELARRLTDRFHGDGRRRGGRGALRPGPRARASSPTRSRSPGSRPATASRCTCRR